MSKLFGHKQNLSNLNQMSSLNDQDQQVIEIVKPMNSQSLQNPQLQCEYVAEIFEIQQNPLPNNQTTYNHHLNNQRLQSHSSRIIELKNPHQDSQQDQKLSNSSKNPLRQQENTSLHQDNVIQEEERQPSNAEIVDKTSKQEHNIEQTEKSKRSSRACNEQKIPERKRKKIILYKCKVCKTTGKKSTVKMCSKCKFHFHIECIDPEKILSQSKTFVCELCDKESTTTIPVNQSNHHAKSVQSNSQKDSSNRLSENIPQQRSVNGFLNISKLNSIYQSNFKKQEWKRKLYQFYKKYPYCFQKNKIIFPIEDHLLHIYQSILPSYCKTTTPRPLPTLPNDEIPEQYYNELMEIQAFFYHFWQDLQLINFYRPLNFKEVIQTKVEHMKRKNLYEKLSSEEINELYIWILETLLRMYLNDIMDRNRIDNMKFIGLSPFFNLLSVVSEFQKGLSRQLIIKLAPEIIKNITKTPSFKHSFYCDYEDIERNQFQYPKNLTFHNKIKVIIKLIRGLCDTDCFKEIVIKKSQKISMLTKEKGENLQKLKTIQNENIPLRQKIKELENQLKQLAFSDPKEYSKKYEPLNKKLQKLIITHKQNLEKIEQYREKVKQVGRKMPFVNSAVKFLGVDRFKSEYFFYKNDKSRIYVQYRESFLSEQHNRGYMCYTSKEEIDKLKSWLNGKGANQKGLLFNITNLEQKDLLIFSQKNENDVFTNSQKNPMIIEQEKRLSQLETVTREENLSTLIYCENLYKQTLQNNQSLTLREKEMQQIFEKLSQTNQHRQKQSENLQPSLHPFKQLLCKYPSKLLHWNQKAKRFWYQFLDIYSNEHHYQAQGNFFLLITIWKISMTLYHNEFIRKKQKIEKKKEKFQKTIREKQLQNLIFRDPQFQQQQTSQHQQHSTPYDPQENQTTGRKLRKRLNKTPIKEQEDLTPEQSLYSSSKKQSSNQEEASEAKSEKINKNEVKNQQEKEPVKINHQKAKKNKKKFEIESQSPSISSKIDQLSSKKLSSSQKSLVSSNQPPQEFQEQKVLPLQQFCEECFQNINYDKPSKINAVKCNQCSKSYHKKCLKQDDSLKMKAVNSWKCNDCSQNLKLQKVNGKKNSRIHGQIIMQEAITPETAKIKSKNDTQPVKKNEKKTKKLFGQNQQASKSSQKAEKKQRKRKVQNKTDFSKQINSQSDQEFEEQEEILGSKKRKVEEYNKHKNDNKNARVTLQKNKKPNSKGKIEQTTKTEQQQKPIRSLRQNINRKKIVESQTSEQQESNSEEQQFNEAEAI